MMVTFTPLLIIRWQQILFAHSMMKSPLSPLPKEEILDTQVGLLSFWNLIYTIITHWTIPMNVYIFPAAPRLNFHIYTTSNFPPATNLSFEAFNLFHHESLNWGLLQILCRPLCEAYWTGPNFKCIHYSWTVNFNTGEF